MRSQTTLDWKELIKQQESSGKNAIKWCHEHNVSYKAFLYQRKRLSEIHVAKSPFVELHEDISEPSWIEVTTYGAKLILAKKFNKSALIRLLEVLKRL